MIKQQSIEKILHNLNNPNDSIISLTVMQELQNILNFDSSNFCTVLQTALRLKDISKQEQLIDLLSSYKSKINYLQICSLDFLLPSIDILQKLMDAGLTNDSALKLIIKAVTSSYEGFELYPQKVELQKQLIHSILEKNVHINKIIDAFDQGNTVADIFAHKDWIMEYAGATALLVATLQSNIEQNEELALEMVRLAITSGADVNINYSGVTPLDMSIDPEIANLLTEHGAKCSNFPLYEISEGGFMQFLINPFEVVKQKYQNLNAERDLKAKMPYVVHHIWFTSSDNAKEIMSQDLENVSNTKDIFATAPVDWNHIVWVNDKNLIPNSIRFLESKGVEVRSIYDYADSLDCFDIIVDLISIKDWGKASDLARYAIIKDLGGIYADLNFKFTRHLTDEAHKYNFIGKIKEAAYLHDVFIENYFFGASKNHPVLKKAMLLVERNLIDPPSYIADIVNKDARIITDLSTSYPLYLAYYTEANKNGNIDVIYPWNVDSEHNSRNSDSVLEYLDYFSSDGELCTPLFDSVKYVAMNEICGTKELNIGDDASIPLSSWTF